MAVHSVSSQAAPPAHVQQSKPPAAPKPPANTQNSGSVHKVDIKA